MDAVRHDAGMLASYGAFDPYCGGPAPDHLTGYLLVATPRLVDPNFERTVSLVLDHGDHGALGVVIDSPGGVDVGEILPAWRSLAAAPAEIFRGGPVASNALVALGRLTAPVDPGGGDEPLGWRLVVGGDGPVGTFDLSVPPVPTIDAVRVFAGYAGWDAGQLEDEIATGSWYVVPAEPGDALDGDPGSMWARVLRRQGGTWAVVASYPADPSVN